MTRARSWALLVFALFTWGLASPVTAAAPLPPEDDGPQRLLASGPADGLGIQLFTIGDDGSGLMQLTSGVGIERNLRPTWSPDGTRVAWTGRVGSRTDVFVTDADGTNRSAITLIDDGPAANRAPAWSPDGTKLAWAGNDGATYQVYVANADGTGRTAISNGGGGGPTDNNHPVWSPDGSSIAWDGATSGERHIMVSSADGTGRTAITGGSGLTWNIHPQWSPDGSRIVWSGGDGTAQIQIANPDGSARTTISTVGSDPDPIDNQTPTWSPDGTKIAWSGSGGVTTQIYVANPDGTARLSVSDVGVGPDPLLNRDPVWSPNSSQIGWVSQGASAAVEPEFYVSAADGSSRSVVAGVAPRGDYVGDARVAWSPNGSLLAWANEFNDDIGMVINTLDGSSSIRVSHLGNNSAPGRNIGGTWSPDGLRIAWSGHDGTTQQIYVAAYDGSAVSKISGVTSGPDPISNTSPTWSPDGSRIAWVGSDGTDRHVYSATPDGTVRIKVSDVGPGPELTHNAFPEWSPDSSHLAWDAQSGSDLVVVVADADGGGRQVIASAGFLFPGATPQPTWSPDGTRLAFAGGDGIHVIDGDGGNDTTIVSGTPFSLSPRWSPDGTRLAWTSVGAIHAMDPDGTNDVVISSAAPGPNVGYNVHPSWSPDGIQIAWTRGDTLLIADADGANARILGDRLGGASWQPTAEVPPVVPPVTDQTPEGATVFVALTPERLFDTRDNAAPGPKGKLAPTAFIDVQVHGVGGVPEDAVAVVMNLTATDATAAGFVSAHGTGTDRPNASNLNLTEPGQTRPNLVTVPIGAEGKVRLYTQSGTHLLGDVAGYYVSVTEATSAGRVVPVTPTRIFDTRPSQAAPGPKGKLDARASVRVQILGVGPIPTSGVSAIIVNLTGTDATGDGFVTVHPTGVARPRASVLNLEEGGTAPNLVMVPVGADGSITIYSDAGAHLLADVTGYVTDATTAASTRGMFISLAPDRIFDTRPSQPAAGPKGKLDAAASITVQTAGRAGLPTSGVAAVVVNVTATGADTGYVTAWPTGADQPLASTLNLTGPDDTRPNAAILPVSTDGRLDYYVQTPAHLLADTAGYYTA